MRFKEYLEENIGNSVELKYSFWLYEHLDNSQVDSIRENIKNTIGNEDHHLLLQGSTSSFIVLMPKISRYDKSFISKITQDLDNVISETLKSWGIGISSEEWSMTFKGLPTGVIDLENIPILINLKKEDELTGIEKKILGAYNLTIADFYNKREKPFPVLSLLKINPYIEIELYISAQVKQTDLGKVLQIVQKYLETGNSSDTVIDCQEELIDYGFKDYAKF
jgi:hypothetical protein